MARDGAGSRRRKSPDYLHFRVPADVREQIDQIIATMHAQGIPATRSAVARNLIHQALGNDAARAELQESLSSVYQVVQRTVGEIVDDARSTLSERLEHNLELLYGPRSP